MPPRNQVLDAQLADGQVQGTHRVQLRTAQVDLRDARRGDGLQRRPAQREDAGDRDGVQVGDGVDHVLTVVGFELHRQHDTVTRQRGRHPAAHLEQELAERDARHDVQHDAAGPDGQVAGREIGPVTQLLGGSVDGRPRLRRDGLARHVVEHVRHGGRRDIGQASHVGLGGPRRSPCCHRVMVSGAPVAAARSAVAAHASLPIGCTARVHVSMVVATTLVSLVSGTVTSKAV